MEKTEITAGSVFVVEYPFYREKVRLFDGEGPYETMSWRPGIYYEQTSPYGDGEAFAHAVGRQTLTVISTHKPGKYPERVFFTRSWTDPDGKSFGKTKLRITTAGAFRTLSNGFRVEYKIAAESKAA